jgi:hypothetical protein
MVVCVSKWARSVPPSLINCDERFHAMSGCDCHKADAFKNTNFRPKRVRRVNSGQLQRKIFLIQLIKCEAQPTLRPDNNSLKRPERKASGRWFTMQIDFQYWLCGFKSIKLRDESLTHNFPVSIASWPHRPIEAALCVAFFRRFLTFCLSRSQCRMGKLLKRRLVSRNMVISGLFFGFSNRTVKLPHHQEPQTSQLIVNFWVCNAIIALNEPKLTSTRSTMHR